MEACYPKETTAKKERRKAEGFPPNTLSIGLLLEVMR